MLVCDKRDIAITCEFCSDLHLTSMFSGLYKNICLMESEVCRKVISKKILSGLAHKVCCLCSSPVLLHISSLMWSSHKSDYTISIVCKSSPLICDKDKV